MTYELRPAVRECKWLLLFKIILKFSNSLCFPRVFPKFSNSLCFPCLELLFTIFPVFPVQWEPCVYLGHEGGSKASLIVITGRNSLHHARYRVVQLTGPAATRTHVDDLSQELGVQTQSTSKRKNN